MTFGSRSWSSAQLKFSGAFKVTSKIFGLAILAMYSTNSPASAAAEADSTSPAAIFEDVGAVYVSTNGSNGNAVLVFSRSADGALTPAGSFSTGGLGSGGQEPDFGLGNAGALALSNDDRFLFAANSGSNDISVFAVTPGGLTLVDRQKSGGQQPLSVTVNQDLLYVLNAGGNVGGSDTIAGFTFDRHGKLSPLSGSTRSLSAASTAPAEIRFRPDGRVLVVTEKSTNNIDTYVVGTDGRAVGPRVIPADAETPFGFDLKRNQLFVTDDFNDAPDAGALSSYLVENDGALRAVSSVVPANESGACWVKISNDDRYAYVSDTVSSTVTVYAIDGRTGSVALRGAVPSPVGPTELEFSSDGRFLYVLNPDEFNRSTPPGVNTFRVNQQDGTLTPLPGISGLPTTVDGLAAR
jgi:6-phosphogluconolactonase